MAEPTQTSVQGIIRRYVPDRGVMALHAVMTFAVWVPYETTMLTLDRVQRDLMSYFMRQLSDALRLTLYQWVMAEFAMPWRAYDAMPDLGEMVVVPPPLHPEYQPFLTLGSGQLNGIAEFELDVLERPRAHARASLAAQVLTDVFLGVDLGRITAPVQRQRRLRLKPF